MDDLSERFLAISGSVGNIGGFLDKALPDYGPAQAGNLFYDKRI